MPSWLMPFLNLALVLRKIAHDVGVQVEGLHGHVVLRPQLLRERPGRVQHVHAESPAARRKLAQQQRRNRRLHALESFNLLLHAVFIHAEVGGLQPGHKLVRFFQQHAHVHRHLRHGDVH